MLIQGRGKRHLLTLKRSRLQRTVTLSYYGADDEHTPYRALYFMTEQLYFVPGTAFAPIAISAWPEPAKSLLEESQHLSTREADGMCRGEDAYHGNEKATGQACMYSVFTQDLPRATLASYQEHHVTSDARLAWLPSKYRLIDTSLPLSREKLPHDFSCACQLFFL